MHKKHYIQGKLEAAPDQKTVRVIASSGAVDRQGETLSPTGWVLENFKKNPVLLWSHDAFALPIGKVVSIEVNIAGQLIADIEFASNISDFAAKVEMMVRAGIINAVSVGFMPIEMDGEGNMTKQELLELSVVNVPANQEALVLQRGGEQVMVLKSFKEAEKKAVQAARHDEQVSEVDRLKKEVEGLQVKLDASVKEGRVLSESNRKLIQNMVDAARTAADTGQKLIETSSPPERRAERVDTKAVSSPRLRSLRIIDRAVESLLREEKTASTSS